MGVNFEEECLNEEQTWPRQPKTNCPEKEGKFQINFSTYYISFGINKYEIYIKSATKITGLWLANWSDYIINKVQFKFSNSKVLLVEFDVNKLITVKEVNYSTQASRFSRTHAYQHNRKLKKEC